MADSSIPKGLRLKAQGWRRSFGANPGITSQIIPNPVGVARLSGAALRQLKKTDVTPMGLKTSFS
jgi:hypothetical protein